MTEVRWTTQAADDLQAIYDFIGRDSEQYAQVIIEGILAEYLDIFRPSRPEKIGKREAH